MEKIKLISSTRIKRIRAQGYFEYSDAEVSEFAFGNRFAYILCSSVLATGVIMANVPILSAMMVVAFLSVLLPYHPFDYIYNLLLRKRLDKPKLPPRSRQLKFACMVATAWIGITISLFLTGEQGAGFVFGFILVAVAFLVSTTDICIPSIFYNLIFKPQK